MLNRHIHSEPWPYLYLFESCIHACMQQWGFCTLMHSCIAFHQEWISLTLIKFCVRLLLESLQRQCWTVASSTVTPTASLAWKRCVWWMYYSVWCPGLGCWSERVIIKHSQSYTYFYYSIMVAYSVTVAIPYVILCPLVLSHDHGTTAICCKAVAWLSMAVHMELSYYCTGNTVLNNLPVFHIESLILW